MASEPLPLMLVTAPDCHLCAHARAVLARLAGEQALLIEERPWNDAEASAWVRRDGVPFPPALYLAGRLCAYGRLSEGRLRRLLAKGGPA